MVFNEYIFKYIKIIQNLFILNNWLVFLNNNEYHYTIVSNFNI